MPSPIMPSTVSNIVSKHDHNPPPALHPTKFSEQNTVLFNKPYSDHNQRFGQGRIGDHNSSSDSSIDDTSFIFPSADLNLSSSSQLHRQRGMSRYDHNPLSQGYPIKLAPVPEQSDPMDIPYDGGLWRRSRQGIFNGQHNGSCSSLEETSFLFPSAVVDLSNSSPSQLQRQRGMRKKSGTRRADNRWRQFSQDGMVLSNNSAIRNHCDDVPDPQGSSRQIGKHIRQQAKEKELQRQKDINRKQQMKKEDVSFSRRSEQP